MLKPKAMVNLLPKVFLIAFYLAVSVIAAPEVSYTQS